MVYESSWLQSEAGKSILLGHTSSIKSTFLTAGSKQLSPAGTTSSKQHKTLISNLKLSVNLSKLTSQCLGQQHKWNFQQI